MKISSTDTNLWIIGTNLTRHHIIPGEKLKKFFNIIIKSDKDLDKFVPFLYLLHYNVGNEKKKYFDDISFSVDCLNRSIHRISDNGGEEMCLYDIEDKFRNGLDGVHALFYWLPCNLFIGPRPDKRAKDAQSKFEEEVKHLLPDELFQLLKNLDILVDKYIFKPVSCKFLNYIKE